MKFYLNRFLILTILLFGGIMCHAQRSAMFYQNFVLANQKIYVFHADGTLKIFDDENGKLIDTYSPTPEIKLLLQDHVGAPIVVNTKNQVKRLNRDQKWDLVTSFNEGNLYRVAFNNDNDCFLITDKGIVNAKTRKAYMPGNSLYHSESALRGGEAFHSIDDDVSTYVDNDNNLWVFFGHGEWGDDMFIFNTKNSNFIPLSDWIAIPSYEATDHLFSLTSVFDDSYIVQYDKIFGNDQLISSFKGKEVYKSSDDSTFPGGIRNLDFFVGGFSVKKNENCLYFITSKGLCKLNLSAHITKFGDATPITSFVFPKDATKGYLFIGNQKVTENLNNAYPQPVSKIQFTPKEKLILLAPMFGVWLFDGKKLTIVE